MAHITNKELTIRQIGEFCTNTLCNKCPVAKWNEESNVSCSLLLEMWSEIGLGV